MVPSVFICGPISIYKLTKKKINKLYQTGGFYENNKGRCITGTDSVKKKGTGVQQYAEFIRMRDLWRRRGCFGLWGSPGFRIWYCSEFRQTHHWDEPLEHEIIWDKLYRSTFWGQNGGPVIFAGISAIDIALWDIKGKYYNAPVHELLGGKRRPQLRTYASQLQFGWGRMLFPREPRRIMPERQSGQWTTDTTALKSTFSPLNRTTAPTRTQTALVC